MKLLYFPIRGLAESIRLLLIDNGVEFEEINAIEKGRDQWANEWKPKMQFGQCPCLYDGDLQLVQSNAILRHLARKYDLYGSNESEAVMLDMVNDAVHDLRMVYVKLIYQNYDEGKADYIAGLPDRLLPFEKILKEGKYIAGDKVGFADYNLFEALDIHLVLAPNCLDKFPKLKAYHAKMLERPGIKKRHQAEGFDKIDINGNGKQ